MKKPESCLYRLHILLLATVFAGPSFAQGDTALEEIVVTANKRGAVSLQDTAGSITAITADTLERTQVEGFEDYIKMVPGLTSVSSGPGQSQIVIRGVNAVRIIHNAPQARSLAGLYIDEMPISVAGYNPDLGVVDIERIEVLRGPQGTLYGASSMAGTIRVVTARPDTEEFSGNFGANVSHTEEGDINHRVKGSVNVPISDRVAMRLNAYHSSKGGFIDNVASGMEEKDYNSEEIFGGRAQIAYYGDKLNAVAAVMYNDLESDGPPDEYLPDPDDPIIGAVSKEFQTVKLVQDFYDQDFFAFNFNLDYDFGPVLFTSATSYFDMEIAKSLDDTYRVLAVTPIPAPWSDYQAWDTNESVIQEIRLSSNNDARLEWLIGGYYEANDRQFLQTQPTPNLNAFFVSIGGPPPCPTLTGPCFGAVADSVFDGTTTIDSEQLAAFGEATFHFTDALRLKLGFRYFDYENDVYIFGSGVANGGVTIDEKIIKEDDWVPKVEVSFDVSEDHMVYATYSEGYRLGGINGFIPEVCRAEVAALGSSYDAPFSSDSLENYEIGAKTSWLDNRLTANLAVYYNEFDDIQTNVPLNCGFFQMLNTGRIENTGFEGDFTFLASEALTLQFGFAYVDSEVAKAVPGINADGDEPPYIPEFTASGSVDYGIPLGNGSGFIRADVRHVGSSGNEFSSQPTLSTLPSYTIVDLTLGYEMNDWSLSVFAKNLFDDDVITNIDPDRIQPDQLSRGLPRTLGVGVSRKF